MRQLSITNCGKCYSKLEQLLQIRVTVITKCGSYYKYGQNLLQIEEGIQTRAIITKWGHNSSKNIFLKTSFMPFIRKKDWLQKTLLSSFNQKETNKTERITKILRLAYLSCILKNWYKCWWNLQGKFSFFICIWQVIGLQKRKVFHCIIRLMLNYVDKNCIITNLPGQYYTYVIIMYTSIATWIYLLGFGATYKVNFIITQGWRTSYDIK